jgi:two-component system, LytTR family, response regulator
MTALLIDDEQSARDTLKVLLQNYCPTVEILGEADSGEAGIESIHLHKPEVVFLDVQLQDMTSFEMLDTLGFPNVDFEIVFSTAHNHYAATAFRYSAIDFLQKPVRERDLQLTVMRAQERLLNKQKLENYDILKENMKPQAQSKIVLRTMAGIYIVPITDVIRLQTVQGKTMTDITLTNKRQQIVTKNLGEFENLDPFIRIHNAMLINSNHIVRINKSTNAWQIEMSDGAVVDVGKSKKDNLMGWLEKFE